MRQVNGLLGIATPGAGLVEVTDQVARWVGAQAMTAGLLTIFCRHTSASLLIQENAAPDVRHDLETFFRQIAPEGPGLYAHNDEGPDDMPAHLRTALSGVNVSIPIAGGRLQLGTWQGIFVFEHRHGAHRRELALHLIGE